MIDTLDRTNMTNTKSVWGKAISLAKLKKLWVNVPDCFVLTTEAFGKKKEIRKDKVYKYFDKLDTKYVAVRSSATVEDGWKNSFAGQFETFLFVSKKDLINKVIECQNWTKLERIQLYYQKRNIDISKIKIAVIVQKMINSEQSGICFTKNPITWNQDEIMIEAVYWLGEAAVSWLVTPDNYLIQKTTKETISKYLSTQDKKMAINDTKWWTKTKDVKFLLRNKEKITPDTISKLCSIAKKIEKFYNYPVDIERANFQWKLFILQARPITA